MVRAEGRERGCWGYLNKLGSGLRGELIRSLAEEAS